MGRTNSIRSLRFAHGEMTQADLASLIGVTRQTVISIEKGRYSPSLEMAFRIAWALGVPLDEVFQYPFPSHNQGDPPMESSEEQQVGRPETGRLVDEVRKLRGRPDTERLVDKVRKLNDQPDTERLIDEVRDLKDQ
jgi:putative transcriptional regulator